MSKHSNQGFIALPLTSWALIGMGAVIIALGIAVKFQTARLESCKAEYQSFVSKTETLGLEAKAKVKQIEAQDKLKKEKADADRKKLLADNADMARRLRDARSRSRELPPAPPASRRPDLICFDREAYQRAYGELVAEVRGLADEGTESTINLDVAKEWAQGR